MKIIKTPKKLISETLGYDKDWKLVERSEIYKKPSYLVLQGNMAYGHYFNICGHKVDFIVGNFLHQILKLKKNQI